MLKKNWPDDDVEQRRDRQQEHGQRHAPELEVGVAEEHQQQREHDHDEDAEDERRDRERDRRSDAPLQLVADVAPAVGGAEVEREELRRALDEDRVRQLPRALLLAVPEQRLVVAALHLPLLDRVLRDALAADVHPRHVVRRVHREEQQEREQVDADQDQHAVADPADDVVDHDAAPSAASVRAAVSRSRRRQANHAGTMAATSASAMQRNRPPDRPVPFGDLSRAELGIEPQVADVVAHDLRRLAVADPLVIGRRRRREVAEAPHRVVLHDLDHPVDELLLLRAVLEELHLLEQLVELRILVVRVVLAVAVGQRLRVRPVQHEQEVLRVRIVGEPAPEEDLDRALGHLVLEAVVVGRAHLHLHADLRELLRVPVEQRLDAGRRRGLIVEIEHQRLAGLRVAAVGIARLGEQLLRLVDASGAPACRPDPCGRPPD